VSFTAKTLFVASQRVFIIICLFRYRLSPETFGYTLVYWVLFERLTAFVGQLCREITLAKLLRTIPQDTVTVCFVVLHHHSAE
jgi:hypothetical protein